MEHDPTPDSLTFEEVLEGVGRRAYGPLFITVGLVALSPVTIVPGLTWLFAGLVFLIAVQMAVGAATPWLPPPLLRLKLPRQPTLGFLRRMRPHAERLERSGWLQTRLAFLSAPPLVNVVALAVIAAALVTIPLGLAPMGAVPPNLAVVAFGLGMTARDGLWLLLGTLVFALAVWAAAPLIFGLFS